MKRVVEEKFAGEKNGRKYFAIVFGATLEGSTLYERKIVYVGETVFEAIEQGMELEIK
jgi:hypothetical protein